MLSIVLGVGNTFFSSKAEGLNKYDEVFTVCVKGYLFVIYKGYQKGGITQMYKQDMKGFRASPPQPVKCEK